MPLPGNQKGRNVEIFLVAGTQQRPTAVREYIQSPSQEMASWASSCQAGLSAAPPSSSELADEISIIKQKAAFLIEPIKRDQLFESRLSGYRVSVRTVHPLQGNM